MLRLNRNATNRLDHASLLPRFLLRPDVDHVEPLAERRLNRRRYVDVRFVAFPTVACNFTFWPQRSRH